MVSIYTLIHESDSKANIERILVVVTKLYGFKGSIRILAFRGIKG